MIETKEELVDLVRKAFEFYVAHGRKKERFGHTLDRIGVDQAFAQIFSGKTEKAEPARDAVSALLRQRNLLDLRGVCCPMNFVKAKLAMDKIKSSETIEFYLDDGEPIVNVTRSLKDEGHRVLSVVPQDAYFKVLVEKGMDREASRQGEDGARIIPGADRSGPHWITDKKGATVRTKICT